MRIGILGGTFNPIHLGHLLLAEEVKNSLYLDRVLFIPSYLPPHKNQENLASASLRLKMVELAISNNPDFQVCDIETKRKGKSYSVETLRELRLVFKALAELFFIVGSDASTYLKGWRDIREMFKLAKFVMAKRPGYAFKKRYKDIITLNIKTLDISGYEIRQRIKRNESIKYLVPEVVGLFIQTNGLYK